MPQLRLNTTPYYDDYDPQKKFYKILFKPGAVVQARELTQIQTILQEQIRRFGDHVFKEGSVITGCAESHNFEFSYVKVLDTDADAEVITDDAFDAFEGKILVGRDSGVRAKVKKVSRGTEGNFPDLKTLFVQYISSGTSQEDKTFFYDEILEVDGDADITLQVAPEAVVSLGKGSLLSLGNGIVYANGTFVLHNDQTVIVDKYSTTPTKKVGFVVVERVVDADDDASLLDPARGSYNYTAPGADRFTLTTQLTVINGEDVVPVGFYLLFEIQDGQIKRRYDKSQYAELGKELARRTYDESGDYTIRPFFLNVREHLQTETNNGRFPDGDASLLAVGVEPGKAYVRGFEHELFATEFLPVSKGLDTRTLDNQPISTAYGQFILVEGVQGPLSFNEGQLLNLRDDVGVIGTARFRNLEYVTGTIGTVGAQYRLYLFDITLSDGTFSDIEEIAVGTDVIATTTFPVLQSASFNTLLFPAPVDAVAATDDISFVYKRQFNNVAVGTNGVFSVSLSAGETWAFSATDDLTVDREIIVIAENGFSGGSIGTIDANSVLDFADGSRTVTFTSPTTLTFDMDGTTTGTPTVSVVVNVRRTNAIPNTKTLRKNRAVKLDLDTHPNANTGPWSLGFADVFRVMSVWKAEASVSFPAIDLTSQEPDDADWEEVTDHFELVVNQTDSWYDLSYLVKSPSSTLSILADDKLLVKVEFFEHAGTSGFYTVDSYPLPVAGDAPSASQIEWYEIPQYTSASGELYDLRDTVDFRMTATNVAANVTTVGDASTNPVAYTPETLVFSPAVLTPAPTEEMIVDLTQHLGRIDRVVLDADGIFTTVQGIADTSPVRPRQPDNAMTIGFVTIPPFPSLSPFVARQVGRLEYGTQNTLVDNRRYTMKDIGDIQRRISRLEYYASLSLLEQSTANLLIANENGDDRFKNGILVDAFSGHNVGNVKDPAYRCSIANGQMRPAFVLENVDFVPLSTSSNIVRNPDDTAIVVRQLLTASRFAVGQTISSTSSGTGEIEHVVSLGATSQYRWVRLYLVNVTGGFAENNEITGSAGATGLISYSGVTSEAIPVLQRPALVKTIAPSNLVTLPYTHSVLSENPYASKTRNCVSQLLFVFDGTLRLDPPVDIWTDTNTQPAVQVNVNGAQDNWAEMSNAWETEWGDWETAWQGVERREEVTGVDVSFLGAVGIPIIRPITETVETTLQRQVREGVTVTRTSETQTTDLGPRVVSANLIPFMRSRVVNFSGARMKPNTRVYAFFDGINVSEHCKLSSSGSYGTALTVDANGTISGQFRIPAGQFTIGTKVFTLVDNAVDPLSSDVSTIATSNFTASGLATVEQNTVLSTQVPVVNVSRQTETREVVIDRQITNNTRPILLAGIDPLAQTFFVSGSPNGVLLTKIETYFRTKSTTSPITLELREVVNGYPSATILPYSQVTLQPNDVNTSEDASAVTVFNFGAPVYLKNDTEYCFVLLPAGNDDGYNVWVSELGRNQIGTTERIDKQPNAGVLFVSANNRTWTAIQSEDIKFTAHVANFQGSSSGVLRLKNAEVDYLKVDIPVNVGDVISQGTGSGVVRYFDSTRNIAQVALTSGYFTVGATDSSVEIVSIENVIVNAISPTCGVLDFNNTDVTWEYSAYSSAQVPMVSPAPLNASGTTELLTERAVFSRSTETQVMSLTSTQGSFAVNATLSTESSNISPVVDLTKVGCVLVANAINNDSSDEDTNDGNAESRYISRRVILDDGQEAEDLRVYLTAYLPAGTDFEVYAKLLNDTDPTPFADRPWLKMDKNGPLSATGFAEFVYTIPVGNTDTVRGGGSVEGVYVYTAGGTEYIGYKVYAVKIVPLSTASGLVPIARDFRAIALQV